MSTHGIGANRPPPGVPNVSSSAFSGVVTREVWGVRPIVYVPVTFRGCDDCFRVRAEPLLGNAGERGACARSLAAVRERLTDAGAARRPAGAMRSLTPHQGERSGRRSARTRRRRGLRGWLRRHQFRLGEATRAWRRPLRGGEHRLNRLRPSTPWASTGRLARHPSPRHPPRHLGDRPGALGRGCPTDIAGPPPPRRRLRPCL